MENQFHFTFENLKKQYELALANGYTVITCHEYLRLKQLQALPAKTIVNRVDIDLSVKKADRLVSIFNSLSIKATFFLRLHASEYNPFSFEHYKIIKRMIATGHELGYHSEVVDQSVIWEEDAAACLRKDIEVINTMFDIKIQGVASHGGMTGLNNLDFWKDKKPADFGLLYEGYDKEPTYNLFQESFYISDSEWTRWKCYDKGVLCKDDRRSFAAHVLDAHPLIHLLIHPDTYFDHHFYE